MKKKKLKVKNSKFYAINQSPLFKITSKSKLLDILQITNQELKDILKKEGEHNFYHCFINQHGRLIQAPQKLMYKVHNRLATLLSRIETPDYIHYSKKGFSHITNASVHSNAKQIITFDIKSYYPSITDEKIQKFFTQVLQCEPDIAYILTRICTLNEALPTGSQISNYLCNLVNLSMFKEMNNLALRFGLNFSVYADDITISGDNLNLSHFNTMKKIIERHGYSIKDEKTKRFLANQTALVTGVALSDVLDVRNSFYSELRRFCNSINFYIDRTYALSTSYELC